MKSVDRIDMNKRRAIPAGAKLFLLVAVIFGITLKNCWRKNQDTKIVISNIHVQEFTSVSIDVAFTIENKTSMELEKNILIRVFAPDKKEIASRIAKISILPNSKQKYLKVLQKLNRPIKDENTIANITVELYNPSIF
ncbi:MAG: hypothetical protein K8S23_06555 [Candidatus Cloacimonetes bacterium]|nr:hypothetical protein [Candidatus Cloacimonadota bacterium]